MRYALQNRAFVEPKTRKSRRALKAAGLPKLRFHDLRHQCATLLLQHGVHPKVVSEILGHSQISLTLDTYSHVLLTLKAEAAETMEQALGPVATVAGSKRLN